MRYRIYGHILSCNARLHELELTLPPDSTEHTDLRIQFLSSDESIPLPSSWYLPSPLPTAHPGCVTPKSLQATSCTFLIWPTLCTTRRAIQFAVFRRRKRPHTPCITCSWIRSFPLCSTTKGMRYCTGPRSSHPMAPVHSSVQPAQENLPWRQAFCLRDIPY